MFMMSRVKKLICRASKNMYILICLMQRLGNLIGLSDNDDIVTDIAGLVFPLGCLILYVRKLSSWLDGRAVCGST